MAGNCRCWCGECSYRTAWLSEEESAEQQARHFAEHHPGVAPSHRVEFRAKKHEGAGCVVVVALLLLLLIVLATCQYQSGSASMPQLDAFRLRG
ncbi:hypothetical protein ABT324_18210 [Saccharopolyspora sp. NPDC000359]|uniref:hypothetical protein n=1 Tax=Saccharopolyspora sp. NPDC000359 TaxID=3154251 RepID=UPI003325C254